MQFMYSSLRKKILILGGSSDISKELINKIDKNKYNIYLHYNKNKPNVTLKNVKFIKMNFTNIDEKNIKDSIKKFKNFDVIINLVGYVDKKSYFTSNYKNLLKSLNAPVT